MAEYLTLPVIRLEQKGRACYVGTMTAEQSAVYTFADSYPPNPDEGRLGYQRQPNERRAKAFADYLRHMDSGFMTPVLLNSRQPLRFYPSSEGSSVGELHLKPGERFAKIDGQHRGIGVEKYLGDPEFPVPFMLFDHLPEDAEQELFISINREQKRVAMSHVLFVNVATGSQDVNTDIALRLNEDDRSPWYRKVNVIGATGTGKQVTLQGLKEALDDLFNHPKVKHLGEEAKYAIAREFWLAAAETWPDAWMSPKNHLITKAVGLFGLSKSGGFIVVEALTGHEDADRVVDVARMREVMGRARQFDWSSKGEFAGIGGRGGADIIADRLGQYFFGMGEP